MAPRGTPAELTPQAARQLAMLAEALLGVAEEELIAASAGRGTGRVETRAAGYQPPEEPGDRRGGGGRARLRPIEGRAAQPPSGFSEPRLPSARPDGDSVAGRARRASLRRVPDDSRASPDGGKKRSPAFLPRPLLPGSSEVQA